MSESKKKVTIDRATWRCGGIVHDPFSSTGRGETRLLNEECFRCCLGFAAKQLGDVSDDDLLGKGYPSSLNRVIQGLTYVNIDHRGQGYFQQTLLVKDAIVINDDAITSLAEKEVALKALFEREGFDLEFTGEYPKEES